MWSSEIGNASVAPSQVRQNLSARRISERSESSIQRGGRIFNHLVNYLTESSLCANIFLASRSRSRGGVCLKRLCLPRMAQTPLQQFLPGECFFVYDVRHLGRIATVVAFQNIDESLHTPSRHSFVWIDIEPRNLRAAGKMME